MLAGIAIHPATWGVFSWNIEEPQPWSTVLDEMAEAGYTGVELGRFGFFPTAPAPLRAALQARGLNAVAGSVVAALSDPAALPPALETAREVSTLLDEVGGRHLVLIDAQGKPPRAATAGRCDAARRLDATQWNQLVAATEQIATIASEHGLSTTFHPHAGTYVEFEDEIERLLRDTDPALVNLCLDTGHTLFAGLDPCDFLQRHRHRVHYLHLKDIDGDQLQQVRQRGWSFQQAVAEGIFCPLGQGLLDLDQLRSTLQQTHYTGWLTVEQDRSTSTGSSPQADAITSLAQLRAADIAQDEQK